MKRTTLIGMAAVVAVLACLPLQAAYAYIDPLENVMREGGPFHVRGELPAYLERLRATGRGELAQALAGKYR